MARSINPYGYIQTRTAADGELRYRARTEVNGRNGPMGSWYPKEIYAKKELSDILERLWNRKAGMPPKDAPRTWKELAGVYIAHREAQVRANQLAASTLKNKIRPAVDKFSAFIGNPLLATITRKEIRAYREHLLERGRKGGKGHSINGVEILMVGLQTTFNYAVAEKFLEVNPVHTEDIPEPVSVVRIFSDAELLDFFEACPEELRRLLQWQYLNKRRIGDVLALDWKLVNLAALTYGLIPPERVGLRRRVNTKGRQPITLPIHPDSVELMGQPKDHGPVFPRYRSSAQVGLAIRRVVKKLGWNRARSHDLRHTAAELYLRLGGSSAVLQRQLAHATKATTDNFYTHVLPATTAAEVSRIRLPRRGGVYGGEEDPKQRTSADSGGHHPHQRRPSAG